MRTPLRASGRSVVALLVTALAAAALVVTGTPASAAGQRLMLRALVVDDGTPWAQAMQDQFTLEGVPFTAVSLSDANRPRLTPGFLADGTTANFNAVVLPSDVPGLGADETAALASFEQTFGVRQIDMYNWANPTVGLNYAADPGYVGDLTGMTGRATAAAAADGFGYLAGPVPIGVGSYGYLATPLDAAALPAGATFTPLVTVPIPGSTSDGSLLGVYDNAGVEKLVITAALSSTLSHFRAHAHGLVTWVTRGVHFGYNRNYLTFHYDDTFSYDARWDTVNNCTPTEDCPSTVTTRTPDIRMTPADVTHVVDWQQAHDYTVTMPFNAYYTQFGADGEPLTTTDPLTAAFVANKSAFRWLNHGYEHIYQGCVQDFTVVPWRCDTTDGLPPAADGSNIAWTSTSAISSEITDNIARGQALGLPFDPSEYLSGEHSGLYLTPQQPVDNPNFISAVTNNGLKYIGADASREPGARTVGSATTVPRHPVAVYYNASTVAEEVDEYNWFYTTRADGGSGYCEDNPATATCLAAPLDPATGFGSYIVPSDAANDLRFVLSNDPRPFYAHVSNLTAPDYLGLALMTEILRQYRTVMAPSAPPVNLTLTEASDVLTKHQSWATVGTGATPQVTGYVQDGDVTVVNPTATAAPLTVPSSTTVAGAGFGARYGGERSAWVDGDASVTVSDQVGTGGVTSAPAFTSHAAALATSGEVFTFQVTTSGAPAAAVTLTGALPAGLTFAPATDGTATIAGTPSATATTGEYALTLGASSSAGAATQSFVLTLGRAPAVTSSARATAVVGRGFSRNVTTSGAPAPELTVTGLPEGLSFAAAATAGRGTISGTPATGTGGAHAVTVRAVNASGTATQSLTLTVRESPAFTSPASVTLARGAAATVTVAASGYPVPRIRRWTSLPSGMRWTANSDGTATISGAPGRTGTTLVALTATNSLGVASQTLTIVVV